MRSYQFLTPSKVGLEFSVLCNTGNNMVVAQVTTIQAGVFHNLEVYYMPALGTIILNYSGGTKTFVTLSASVMARLWIPIKLVVDNVTGYGHRLTIGTQVFSIVDYKQFTGAWAECDQIYIFIVSSPQGAGSLDQYIGHVYLTLDEP